MGGHSSLLDLKIYPLEYYMGPSFKKLPGKVTIWDINIY